MTRGIALYLTGTALLGFWLGQQCPSNPAPKLLIRQQPYNPAVDQLFIHPPMQAPYDFVRL